MATQNLNIQELVDNQTDPEVPINDQTIALENATQRTLDVNLSGNVTLSVLQQSRNFAFNCINNASVRTLSLRTTVDGLANLAHRFLAVTNSGTADIRVNLVGGASPITVPVGETRLIRSTGAALVVLNPRSYDIPNFFPGSPGTTQTLLRWVAPRAVVLPQNLTRSQGLLGVAATGQTDFDLQRNGASFGTMRFAAAGTVATFIAASQTAFAAGDLLSVIAPGVADASAADVSLSLVGTSA